MTFFLPTHFTLKNQGQKHNVTPNNCTRKFQLFVHLPNLKSGSGLMNIYDTKTQPIFESILFSKFSRPITYKIAMQIILTSQFDSQTKWKYASCYNLTSIHTKQFFISFNEYQSH